MSCFLYRRKTKIEAKHSPLISGQLLGTTMKQARTNNITLAWLAEGSQTNLESCFFHAAAIQGTQCRFVSYATAAAAGSRLSAFLFQD